ncbi:hypothetical protein SPBR_05364 [Sporothrix brasiliensis 5110]|uniref:Uncharacterized protein n=1 Tax=Sporothrix brasiliensis 5110 TaxID=1398154 RepID=A0A0C2ILJ4_9PEZI|nr:uncharacterized protein SPBR_05364 [Sporothrix brasiliensis 5110]KIH87880.1 hypothetical protein SPBR_05364 [Sporothrix brasiliensis 5110]
MHSVPPKSPTLSNRSSRDYDTGFPEPFCGNGNTTLRHPDANTSPDACISSDDIAVDHVYMRSRRSFLHKNKRAPLSHGKLTAAELQAYNELSSIVEIPSRTDVSSSAGSLRTDSRQSKDGSESLNRPSSSAHSDVAGLRSINGTLGRTSSVSGQSTISHSGFPRSGSVFRKFRHHD